MDKTLLEETAEWIQKKPQKYFMGVLNQQLVVGYALIQLSYLIQDFSEDWIS